MVRALLAALTLMFAAPLPSASADDAVLWEKLRNGEALVVIRHALAPGTGDPSNFDVDDCSTQRNLNSTGREQSAAIGQLFKDNGLSNMRVKSSQWCRCLDTARLMDVGSVEEFPTINSFFRRYERREPQTTDLINWIKAEGFDEPTVLVTHQVNITALTDVFPSSGEMVFVELNDSGDISVAGTIETLN